MNKLKAHLSSFTVVAALLLIACGGEDRPDVDVIEDGNGTGTG